MEQLKHDPRACGSHFSTDLSLELLPVLPYGRHTITEADIAAVAAVLRSPFLTQGPAVPAFEQAVADKVPRAME